MTGHSNKVWRDCRAQSGRRREWLGAVNGDEGEERADESEVTAFLLDLFLVRFREL